MGKQIVSNKNNSVGANGSWRELWIVEVSVKCGKKLRFIRQLDIKDAEDYLLHTILQDDSGKQYICAKAFNELQKFRLRTSLECIKNAKRVFEAYYLFNEPLWFGEIETINAQAALYLYYSDAKHIDDNSDIPNKILDEVYSDADETEVTEELLKRISQNILTYNFPRCSYEAVIKSKPYNEYMELLRKMGRVRLVNTHFDYSPSNILCHQDHLFLVDFEQGAVDIPIGYDKLHYMKYQNNVKKEELPYYELNECLYRIMHLSKKELGHEKYKPTFILDKGRKSVDIRVGNQITRLNLNKVGEGVLLNLDSIILEPYSYRKLLEYLILIEDIKYVAVYQSIWDLRDKGSRRKNAIEVFSRRTFVAATLLEILTNYVAEKYWMFVMKKRLIR